ncbi:MAG TPA: nicotinate phosphoribosyltransferase [Acidimicrobiales bacterium]|nr:nicotinate phosphoribosyltransferase [Acidimicrobiales bacterium]
MAAAAEDHAQLGEGAAVSAGAAMATTALLTDHYELTMFEAALASGLAHRRAVFEVFARSLPPGRRFGVCCGLARVLEAIVAFRFGPDELAFLERTGVVERATLAHLESLRFSGDVWAYPEGELYFPDSPVLTVDAPWGEAILLETVVLSMLNHDSAVASAAARMSMVAGGRTLIEMGGRRTDAEAGAHAARAAYVAGFASTSNLEAGRTYGVPTAGTVSHAFVLGHASEAEAFAAQVRAMGVGTTLLVDTFDTDRGIRTAVEVAGKGLGAIRIDSGDLGAEAHRARALLDALGARGTRIVVSGDLDEWSLLRLAGAPVDAYGVGTRVVTGSGHPTAGFVYKLVARADTDGRGAPLRPVAKLSEHKATRGGLKRVWRWLDGLGRLVTERAFTGEPPMEDGPPGTHARPLQVQAMADGEVVHRPTLAEVRAHHRSARTELRPEDMALEDGPPALTVEGPAAAT